MTIPERVPVPGRRLKCVYDYDVCNGSDDLSQMLLYINDNGFDLVNVTQDGSGAYTVFFRRWVLA